MVAIPFFIKLMNCLVLFKFCKSYDEMSETYFGGYSICDCFATCCFCWCYKRQAYEAEQRQEKIKGKEQQAADRERKKLEREAMHFHKKKSNEIEVQTKSGCIRNSRCLSCCCFVFGCVGSNSIEHDKTLKHDSPVYFDDEVPNPNALDDDLGGGKSPAFDPGMLDENISFDHNTASMKRDGNSTIDKLNASSYQKKVVDPDEDWE